MLNAFLANPNIVLSVFPFLPGTVIRRQEVEVKLGVSRASAHRWIVKQIAAGKLYRQGTTRDARYEVMVAAVQQVFSPGLGRI